MLKSPVNFLSEILDVSCNDFNICILNEDRVDRLLGKYSNVGYIIISASRGLEDKIEHSQRNIDLNNQKNNQNYSILLKAVKDSGYSFIPVYGGFIENKGTEYEKNVYEKAFIVINYDREGKELDFTKLKNLAIEWCKEFNQDSVLIKAPNNNPTYYKQNGEASDTFTGNIKINDLTQQYFTDFVKTQKLIDNGRRHRFTFENVYINPNPATYPERVRRIRSNEIFLN
jgi:hypothetical protein